VKNPKIAIVHDYLNAYGGQEAVTNAIWEIWKDAPVYTAIWEPNAFKGTSAFKNATVIVPKWSKSKVFNRFYKYFTFLYPIFFENLDLSSFDVVISSSANFAKGVKTATNQLHVSYIHTPPRFLYGYPTETSKRDSWFWKPILKVVDYFLLKWDIKASKRPNFLLCNSSEVQGRIKKFYNRDAKIIYPFINVQDYLEQKDIDSPNNDGEGYYLLITRMSLYKHVDKAIWACAQLGRKLKVAGTGKEFNRFKQIADSCGGDIEMLGFVSDQEKARLFKNCRALIYPVEYEDFGMTPLEAMYFGKPAIVPRQGGFLDTVKDGYNGVFSENSTTSAIVDAIVKFEKIEHSVLWERNCRKTAKRFTKERFQDDIREFVEEHWKNLEQV
jgi:glycosyltransferase involved in cell wall biosynthesis